MNHVVVCPELACRAFFVQNDLSYFSIFTQSINHSLTNTYTLLLPFRLLSIQADENNDEEEGDRRNLKTWNHDKQIYLGNEYDDDEPSFNCKRHYYCNRCMKDELYRRHYKRVCKQYKQYYWMYI